MPIDGIDPIWGESAAAGDLTEPTDTKKAEGYKRKDKFYLNWWNWIQNRIEKKLHRIAIERIDPAFEYTGSQGRAWQIATGQYPTAWACTGDNQNEISIGTGHEIRDIETYIDPTTGDSRLIIADQTNGYFYIYNTRTLVQVDTLDAWTDDLPSGGGEVWGCISICTDNTYVYGLFQDTNASPMDYRIQAWDLATGNVRSGWAATGVDVDTAATNDSGPLSTKRDGRIFVSSLTTLCVVCGWNQISSSASKAISIRDITDGTANTEGAGDAPTGVTAQAIDACSDGTNIMFTCIGGTTLYLASATIADATTGCGGTGWSANYQVGGANNGADICACGPNVIVTAADNSTLGSSDIALKVSNSTDVDWDNILRGHDCQSSPLVGDETTYRYCYGRCFDGLNLWLLTSVELDTGTPAYTLALVKIDVAKFALSDTDNSRFLTDICSVFLMNPDGEEPAAGYVQYLSCRFDGRDIWVNIDPEASGADNSRVKRLPLAVIRH